MDAVILARVQFAATALYHFLFVPLSIGFGLVLAVLMTRAYKSRKPADEALARFWLKLFAGTFAVGVATGITMEFSFGTNWADYSRFVGNIFGAPLAAEALFAFFLESVFLGVLLWGRERVGRRFYLASAWLVWFGSCLSALWIIIANSWMQTPAGYKLVTADNGTTIATMTNFLEAALNHSTLQRYFHVVAALLITGALAAIAIGAYYRLKDREYANATALIRIGTVIGVICTVLMMPAAHMQAMEVAEQQPSKLASMEGQWETGPAELSLFGWVDEDSGTTYTIGIPGGTSFLASGHFDTEYPGINDLEPDMQTGSYNAIYQFYHFMLYFLGLCVIVLILGILASARKITKSKWAFRFMMLGPIFALLAIEDGWFVAELGRQPWIVYGELLTSDATSLAVSPAMLIITLVLFAVVYIAIYALWLRYMGRTIKAGTQPEKAAEALPADAEPEGVWQ